MNQYLLQKLLEPQKFKRLKESLGFANRDNAAMPKPSFDMHLKDVTTMPQSSLPNRKARSWKRKS